MAASEETVQRFEQLVKRYYYQLTQGCGRANCRNRLCASNVDRISIKTTQAAIISIEMASNGALSSQAVCDGIPVDVSVSLPPTMMSGRRSRLGISGGSDSAAGSSGSDDSNGSSFLSRIIASATFSPLLSDVKSPRTVIRDGADPADAAASSSNTSNRTGASRDVVAVSRRKPDAAAAAAADAASSSNSPRDDHVLRDGVEGSVSAAAVAAAAMTTMTASPSTTTTATATTVATASASASSTSATSASSVPPNLTLTSASMQNLSSVASAARVQPLDLQRIDNARQRTRPNLGVSIPNTPESPASPASPRAAYPMPDSPTGAASPFGSPFQSPCSPTASRASQRRASISGTRFFPVSPRSPRTPGSASAALSDSVHPFVSPLLTATPATLVLSFSPRRFTDPFASVAGPNGLNLVLLGQLINACRLSGNFQPLARALQAAFSSTDVLDSSFSADSLAQHRWTGTPRTTTVGTRRFPSISSYGTSGSTATSTASTTTTLSSSSGGAEEGAASASTANMAASLRTTQRRRSDGSAVANAAGDSLDSMASCLARTASSRSISSPVLVTRLAIGTESSRALADSLTPRSATARRRSISVQPLGSLMTKAAMQKLPVDLSEINRFYRAVLSLNHPDVVKAMNTGMENLLARQEYSRVRLQSPEQLRRFLVMLQNPCLCDPANFKPLLRKLLMVIASFTRHSQEVLVAWFALYDKDEFTRLLKMTQTFLVSSFHVHEPMNDSVDVAATVLGLLYEANEKAAVPHVSYTEFYNDVVNETINFKDEYKHWKGLADTDVNSPRTPSGSATTPSTPTTQQQQQQQQQRKQRLRFHAGRQGGRYGSSFLHFPFLLDPASKSRIIRIDAMLQMSQRFEEALVHSSWMLEAAEMLRHKGIGSSQYATAAMRATNPYVVLKVRRSHLIADTLTKINGLREMLKKPLKIQFEGEEGLDQGGVQKEFFQLIVRELFHPDYGLFCFDDETQSFWFNTSLGNGEEDHTRDFELIGIVLGLALYNGVILDSRFPHVMYRKMMGASCGLDHLAQFKPDVARSLQALLSFDGDVEDVFCCTFSVTMPCADGKTVEVDLVPGGRDISVTNDNRREYVDLYVAWMLHGSVAEAFDAFNRGFHLVCGGDALNLCRPEELEILVCGSPELDFDELEDYTQYIEFDPDTSDCIKEFWRIVHRFSDEEKKALLFFVTGSDRIPIEGLSKVGFVIQRNGPDSDRLPTASTCFNRLLLPEYTDADKMRRFLLLAIKHSVGFGLI